MPCKAPGCAEWPGGLIRTISFLSGCKQTINYLSNDYVQMKKSNGLYGQQHAPFMPKGAFKKTKLKWNSQKELPQDSVRHREAVNEPLTTIKELWIWVIEQTMASFAGFVSPV